MKSPSAVIQGIAESLQSGHQTGTRAWKGSLVSPVLEIPWEPFSCGVSASCHTEIKICRSASGFLSSLFFPFKGLPRLSELQVFTWLEGGFGLLTLSLLLIFLTQ